MESIEAELKAMEKNVSKIRAILSSVDSPEVSLEEHLRNRQVRHLRFVVSHSRSFASNFI